MLWDGIIEPIEESEWIGLIMIQEMKTRGIIFCVNLRKLNDACVTDLFPTPFMNDVLETIGGQESYLFTDGLSRYHNIKVT